MNNFNAISFELLFAKSNQNNGKVLLKSNQNDGNI